MYSNNLSLPSGCILRQATSADKWSIRSLVFLAKLDPTQLRWQQFFVVECEGNLIACGQLRNFVGVQELGSLVVTPTWRGRGLGSLLTQHLISQATEPLYLECLGENLSQFYSRFGFVTVDFENIPPSLKHKFGISQFAKQLFRVPIVFMKYCQEWEAKGKV
ncbi:GCN5-related N-acetyltransferase [Nostoc sp. HK-01]|uniref:N-acetyltransferase GCN5 n=1 Tax=Nostoc cycadae WK-1 TaxID=1861711 RepID=A0A2H6LNY6_9NOSO|nr:GNAT family N-acetyltransferase [Nostoc cycadae]BBD62633.1 GCN5-related N-acetyltransferase [Nostoc sp. HK-01]GBE94911.1 N-acetyltransferase GCN5 [Nostoc cycadae WK-1]